MLLLYNDFKSIHDTNKVPLTINDRQGGSGVIYATNQHTSDPLCKTRGVNQIKEETVLACAEKSYCEIRWDKVMSKYIVNSRTVYKGILL